MCCQSTIIFSFKFGMHHDKSIQQKILFLNAAISAFSIGKANFCRTNRVNFKEVKRESMDKQILPAGKRLLYSGLIMNQKENKT